MKKYVLSPLCSALVMPGLGQVLNKRILKGLIIMVLVFVLFIIITLKLALLIIGEIEAGNFEVINNLIENKLLNGELSGMWTLVMIFIIIWVYSIIDAFIEGYKIEKGLKEYKDEILSDR